MRGQEGETRKTTPAHTYQLIWPGLERGMGYGAIRNPGNVGSEIDRRIDRQTEWLAEKEAIDCLPV